MKIRSGDKEESAQALDQVYRNYWAPLYSFLCFQGDSREDAEDLVQGFFLHMVSKGGFAKIKLPPSEELKSNVTSKPTYGTLRSYLLTSLKHFRANVHRGKTALKRGGKEPMFSIDRDFGDRLLNDLRNNCQDPAKCFDRAWAMNLISLATKRLESEYETRGQQEIFENLEPMMARDDNPRDETYAVIAERLSISQQSVKNGVFRLRRKLRHEIKAEIARTIDESEGVTIEGELAALYSILT